MVDERTKEYFRDLLQKTVETAEEICQCASCTAAREKEEITQCDKDRILQYLPMKMIHNPVGFTTELSSNPMYWKLGRRG